MLYAVVKITWKFSPMVTASESATSQDGLKRQPDCDKEDNQAKGQTVADGFQRQPVCDKDDEVHSGRQARILDDCPMTGGIFPNILHEKLGFCNYCLP